MRMRILDGNVGRNDEVELGGGEVGEGGRGIECASADSVAAKHVAEERVAAVAEVGPLVMKGFCLAGGVTACLAVEPGIDENGLAAVGCVDGCEVGLGGSEQQGCGCEQILAGRSGDRLPGAQGGGIVRVGQIAEAHTSEKGVDRETGCGERRLLSRNGRGGESRCEMAEYFQQSSAAGIGGWVVRQ